MKELVATTLKNAPKYGLWERECAKCIRPLPRYFEGITANQLWRLGWIQESDGTWICASCSRLRNK